jgi:SAM-dependent methyltransferase
MDASMKQKVALTAAHLLGLGRAVDMGMGSGSGSLALASLYPGLDVVGVDVNPTMTALAKDRQRAPNLSFVCADIAAHCFRPGALDAVFDSSVLHHVTTFSGYDHGAAARCLEVQTAELKERGVLIVRDFLDPGPGSVLLDLPSADGDGGDDPRSCSSAALFERFAREFRKLHAAPGFPFETVAETPELPLADGFRRYRVSRKLAVEFVLRKDYRADWDTEVLEEYTYFDQERFEAVFAALGLRLLASTPLRNPWIVRNRFRGKFQMRELGGQACEDPPTNFLIAGEKVPPGEGVRFSEGAPARASFLRMDHHRDRRSGRVRDLVRRPHLTLDIVPWFLAEGDPYVVARKSYPRPILRCGPRGTLPLDGSRPADYVTEPLNVLLEDQPLGRTVEQALLRLAGIVPAHIRGVRQGSHYYPSPGGIEEEVRSVFVEVDPLFVERHIAPVSGFSTSGVVRAIEARQLLRAAQVGALPDARLEINAYGLLERLGLDPGAWIGEQVVVGEGPPPERTASLEALARRAPRRVFEPAPEGESPGFLELHASVFEERAADGSVLHARPLEFVLPRALSYNTVAVAPLRRHAGRVLLGVDDDDLPAAQAFSGASELLVAPAWRLPREVASLTPARAWVCERLGREHGLTLGATYELGGRYHPSPGLTPEVVHALAVEVVAEAPAERPLLWLDLAEAAAHAGELRDGHLRTLAQRAAHAMGVRP